jgi:hypothetical protein
VAEEAAAERAAAERAAEATVAAKKEAVEMYWGGCLSSGEGPCLCAVAAAREYHRGVPRGPSSEHPAA